MIDAKPKAEVKDDAEHKEDAQEAALVIGAVFQASAGARDCTACSKL